MNILLRYRFYNKLIGKIHGRGGLFLPTRTPHPPTEQDMPSSFENEIAIHYKMRAERIARKFDEQKGSLCVRCRNLKQNKIPNMKSAIAELKSTFMNAEMRFRKASVDYIGFPKSRLVSALSWLFFVVLMMSDFYFLGTVFLVFLLSKFETAVLAIGTIMAISFLPHFCGRTLKNNERTDSDRTLFIISCVGMVAGSIALSHLRTKFLIASGQVTTVSWSYWEGFLSFLSIQIMIEILFALLGYISGHGRPLSLSKSNAEFKTSSKELKSYRKKLKSIERAEDDAQSILSTVQKEMLVIPDTLKKKMKEDSMRGAQQIQAYRDANISNRTIPPPPCFNIPADKLIGFTYENLGSECNSCPIGNDFIEKTERQYNNLIHTG